MLNEASLRPSLRHSRARIHITTRPAGIRNHDAHTNHNGGCNAESRQGIHHINTEIFLDWWLQFMHSAFRSETC